MEKVLEPDYSRLCQPMGRKAVSFSLAFYFLALLAAQESEGEALRFLPLQQLHPLWRILCSLNKGGHWSL